MRFALQPSLAGRFPSLYSWHYHELGQTIYAEFIWIIAKTKIAKLQKCNTWVSSLERNETERRIHGQQKKKKKKADHKIVVNSCRKLLVYIYVSRLHIEIQSAHLRNCSQHNKVISVLFFSFRIIHVSFRIINYRRSKLKTRFVVVVVVVFFFTLLFIVQRVRAAAAVYNFITVPTYIGIYLASLCFNCAVPGSVYGESDERYPFGIRFACRLRSLNSCKTMNRKHNHLVSLFLSVSLDAQLRSIIRFVCPYTIIAGTLTDIATE